MLGEFGIEILRLRDPKYDCNSIGNELNYNEKVIKK